MEKFIYKSKIAHDRDQDVPEFGGYSFKELAHPLLREVKPDLFSHEAVQGLKKSALERALYFGYGIGNLPPVHFPNAEHFQHIPFRKRHWEQYGNMESEYARLLFMLKEYPSRRFPDAFEPIIKNTLSQSNVLQALSYQLPEIKRISVDVYEQVLQRMNKSKIHDSSGYKNGENGAYESKPISYESSDKICVAEILLWERALSQIIPELQNGNFRNVPSFLSLYNRMKDPISPVKSILSEQVEICINLYKQARSEISIDNINYEKEKVLISQMALEASFLALPLIKDVAFVVYGGHHELPYIYLDIHKLPRGEFANPHRVIEITNELIEDSKKYEQAVITPITVSYYQEPYQAAPHLFLIDGNNRATAVLLMKLFSYAGYNRNEILSKDCLRNFITSLDLDIEWERDIAVALKNVSDNVLDNLLSNQSVVDNFAHAKIPALLVQEPNFHTIAVAQSGGEKIVLLQPMHQVIYNQGRLSMAIPSKQQSHGRAAGNDIRVNLKQES